MAVAIPKGFHQVEFVYKPQSFTGGLVISSTSAAVLLALGIYMAKKKKL